MDTANSTNTATKIRTAEFNDVEYIFECHDPFGFWTVSTVTPMETLPDSIKGHFTTFDRAALAAQSIPEGSLRPKKREDKLLVAKTRQTVKEV